MNSKFFILRNQMIMSVDSYVSNFVTNFYCFWKYVYFTYKTYIFYVSSCFPPLLFRKSFQNRSSHTYRRSAGTDKHTYNNVNCVYLHIMHLVKCFCIKLQTDTRTTMDTLKHYNTFQWNKKTELRKYQDNFTHSRETGAQRQENERAVKLVKPVYRRSPHRGLIHKSAQALFAEGETTNIIHINLQPISQRVISVTHWLPE